MYLTLTRNHYLSFFFSLLMISPTYSYQLDQEPFLIDRIVRDTAVRSYHTKKHRKTAVIYNLSLPSILSGALAESVRYRAGSLRRYGAPLGEFFVPPGIVAHPNVKRLLVIRQNLGNLSSIYNQYINSNPRFKLVSPVLGLLFYNAASLYNSSANTLNIMVTRTPILVNFSRIIGNRVLLRTLCVVFQLEGNVSVTNQIGNNVCITWQQGHFALVIEEDSNNTDSGFKVSEISKWKVIMVGVLAGTAGAVFLGLVVLAMVSVRKKRIAMAEMERRAYEEEALRVSMVGHVRAPTATGARTKPALENEYALNL